MLIFIAQVIFSLDFEIKLLFFSSKRYNLKRKKKFTTKQVILLRRIERVFMIHKLFFF